MKATSFLISGLSLVAFLQWGCKESPINIPELTVGDRKVLVEELTGVRCPNCPDGAAELAALGQQYGDKLIVVSIHAAPGYDVPYPENQYDFRTTDGNEMAAFIGQASFFPTASVNRRLVPPETEVYLPRAAWAGIIAEELQKQPQIGVYLENAFNAVSRELKIKVNLTPENNLSGEHRLTVLITQDSIQDVQKVGSQKVLDYQHRHVLRDIVSQSTGDIITEALNAGQLVTKQYTITLPADWDEHHCNVVAYVHHGTSPDKEVLQAEEKHVVE